MAVSDHSATWLWYAVKTAGLVELDLSVYPSIKLLNSDPLLSWEQAKPKWACQSPNGGLHIHAGAGRIDVHVAERPLRTVELNAIRGYSLTLVATCWLSLISDLVDPERVFLGNVILKGEKLPDWRTIRSLIRPSLRSRKETLCPPCPLCGQLTSFPKTNQFWFDNPQAAGQALLATESGLFVRKDLALACGLRRPHGAFKPLRVVLKEGAVARATEGDS